MKGHNRFHVLRLIAYAALLMAGLLAALLARPAATARAEADASNAVEAAWARVRVAGSYRFTLVAEQTFVPRPLPTLIGHQEERLDLHIQGQAVAPDDLTMTVWFEGAEATPATLMHRDGQTFLQKGDSWEAIQALDGGLAIPSSDLLGYLAAAENTRRLQSVVAGGQRFSRYAFEVDGERYAAFWRDQLRARLRPELPPGVELTPPAVLARLGGSGELWLDGEGLPRRQILNLALPEASEAYDARIHLVMDFRDFGFQPGEEGIEEIGGTGGSLPDGEVEQPEAWLNVLLWLAAGGALVTAAVIARCGRRLYPAVVGVMIALMVGEPLL
ncbi:MAG: hypothetical protein L0332_29715, partial [Chloroflexi bacterium]|nr:hypothetical protein [Chloroflexota bacterium]MCI0581063.1 hypothetical protein [Chloroflexota bacterium]MCI0730878.1 hypothetical protein [Chloroflexota bacterium]